MKFLLLLLLQFTPLIVFSQIEDDIETTPTVVFEICQYPSNSFNGTQKELSYLYAKIESKK